MNATYTEAAWMQTPLGAYLSAQEQAIYDTAVADVFGFNAVQLGRHDWPLLRQSRIPHCFSACPDDGGNVCCFAEQLPFASASVDLVLLPHQLEFSIDPHLALREVERILRPEGYLMLSGYNPLSLWGARRGFGGRQGYPWHGKFIHLARIKDWLALLGFEVTGGKMLAYIPPVVGTAALERLRFVDRAGDRWWPMMGGVYFLVAKKRVAAMRLIRPQWRATRVAAALLPKPARKVKYQKDEQ